MDNIDLSDFFLTKSEAAEFSEHLSRISEKIYENNFNLENELLAEMGIEKKDKFLQLLRNNNINYGSQPSLNEFLNKIQKKIVSMYVVSLIIAFEPSESTLKKLSDWFMLNVKKQAVFDIKVDRKIVAGACVLAGGNYRDYSIKSRVDEILKSLITEKTSQNAVKNNPVVRQDIEHIVIAR